MRHEFEPFVRVLQALEEELASPGVSLEDTAQRLINLIEHAAEVIKSTLGTLPPKAGSCLSRAVSVVIYQRDLPAAKDLIQEALEAASSEMAGMSQFRTSP